MAIQATYKNCANAPSVWSAIVARYAKARADYIQPDISDDDLHVAMDAAREAVDDLLSQRAADCTALAFKARAVLEEMTGFADESADDPRTLSMMLDASLHDAFLASAYQDALSMAGLRPDLCAARPNGFVARQWLAAVEVRTGARLINNPDPDGPLCMFVGNGTELAEEAFATLMSREREWVQMSIFGKGDRS